jgi:hypothetical protein
LTDTINNEIIQILLTRDKLSYLDENKDTPDKRIDDNHTFYYLIGGGLSLGICAVLTKTHADNLETEYQNNHSPAVKDNIRIFDSISGISLMGFEACFLVLSYLLLSN